MSEQKFKDNDEILIRAKIIQTDNSCLPYKIAISDKSTAWLYEDLEDHATLIDPNIPQAGDKVWVWNYDDDDDYDDDYYEANYIGKSIRNDEEPYTVLCKDDSNDYPTTWKHISLTDPRKKEETITIDGIEYSKETLTT